MILELGIPPSLSEVIKIHMDNNMLQQQQFNEQNRLFQEQMQRDQQQQQQQQFNEQNRLFQEQMQRDQQQQQQQQFNEQNRLFQQQAQQGQQQLAIHQALSDYRLSTDNKQQAVSRNHSGRDRGTTRYKWSLWDKFLIVVWATALMYFIFFRNGGVITLPW